jgi:hypothetical protein
MAKHLERHLGRVTLGELTGPQLTDVYGVLLDAGFVVSDGGRRSRRRMWARPTIWLPSRPLVRTGGSAFGPHVLSASAVQP